METQNDDLLKDADDTPIERLRHSASHMMAQAVKRLWPDASFGVGPTIENGFYYDIDMSHRLTDEDVKKIEKEMKNISKEKLDIIREELSKDDALKFFKGNGQKFKVELIESFPEGETISTYRQGDFVDLCRGPHIENTKELHYFKLLNVSGAFWRGDDKNPQLQRIYGTAWETKEELKEHLHFLEEAKKRDHRKLGVQLDLFHFHPWSPAMPFFHPKGAFIYNRLIQFMRDQYEEQGYQEVVTPQVFDAEMWKVSGHYEHYMEGMYFVDPGKIREESGSSREFGIKPMNCPSHALIFKARKNSYRDLPFRMADFGRLHRYEKSGATQGLTRVRSLTQDDAHIFCEMDQVPGEIKSQVSWMFKVYEKVFGFSDLSVELSTRPEDKVGSDEIWDVAENSLSETLKEIGLEYKLNPGDGAFYGPKIDFHLKDALNRTWQVATFQLDFNMAERFDLKYTSKEGEEKRPVVIHRAILGSIERFFGILIEHMGGAFPFWLTPVQANIIAVSDEKHMDFCRKFEKKAKSAGFRVHVDDRSESMGKKTRETQTQKIPFMLVAGDRELEEGSFSVRKYGEQEQKSMKIDKILEMFAELDREWEKARG